MHRFQTFLLILVFCFSAGLHVHAQGVLTGTWQGKLFQDRSPESTTFKVRMVLKHEGSRVTGMTYIHVEDEPEYRAQMVLQGQVYGAIFTFQETRVVYKNNPIDWDWCMKSGRMLLKRNGNYWRIEGTVDGMLGDIPCVEADASLERLDPIGKPDPPVQVQPKQPAEVVVAVPLDTTPVPKPKPVPTKPEAPQPTYGDLLGRKITHQRDIEVHQSQLELQVWDADKEDGDVISLSFNGQWLLRNHPVTKERKLVTVKVEPGKDNKLILYAESEGAMPPNTAAITFFDGSSTRNLNLSSSKSTCGALRFVYRP